MIFSIKPIRFHYVLLFHAHNIQNECNHILLIGFPINKNLRKLYNMYSYKYLRLYSSMLYESEVLWA